MRRARKAPGLGRKVDAWPCGNLGAKNPRSTSCPYPLMSWYEGNYLVVALYEFLPVMFWSLFFPSGLLIVYYRMLAPYGILTVALQAVPWPFPLQSSTTTECI